MPVLVRSRLRNKGLFSPGIQALAQRILAAVGEASVELSLEVVGDGRIRGLNRRYRKRDAPTDVLAFPIREARGPSSPLLGDVVISLHTAVRQAVRRHHSLEREFTVLLIHGILHLCGYDHERSDREAQRMRRKERAILRKLGRIPRLFCSRGA